MRRFPVFFGVLLAGWILQGLLRHFPFIGVRLDIVWLVVLYIGFFVPTVPGVFYVTLIGFVQESLATPFHGIIALSYLTVYGFIRIFHHHLFFQGLTSQLIWIFLLSLLYKAVEFGFLLWVGYDVSLLPVELTRQLGSSLLAGLFSLVLFPFLRSGGRLTPFLPSQREKPPKLILRMGR